MRKENVWHREKTQFLFSIAKTFFNDSVKITEVVET
ncbi:hypothetical protein IMSAGC021_01596 [Muribaculaceae bacterium]|nr:hypothetical protein IMSAGC021_01596 [Muribaculaceae bacterium]